MAGASKTYGWTGRVRPVMIVVKSRIASFPRKAGIQGLHRYSACFETRLSGAPQHEVMLVTALWKIPHPEETAKRSSRRTHRADPANGRLFHAFFRGGTIRRLEREE